MNLHILRVGLVLTVLFVGMLGAHAQVSYHAFEAVADERLSVELRDGETIEGALRYVDDVRAVMMSEAGDVQEFALEDVARLRVISPPSSTSSAPDQPEEGAETAKSSAPKNTSTPRFDTPFSPVPRSENGYLPDAQMPQRNPFQGTTSSYEAPRHGLVLTRTDYAAYQEMISQSRTKRVVGWSFFATGVAFLMVLVAEVHDARQWGVKPRVGGLAAVGAVSSLVGLPIAIAGRQQYKRAGRMAEQAAAARAKIEQEKQRDEKKRAAKPSAFDTHTTRDVKSSSSDKIHAESPAQSDPLPAPEDESPPPTEKSNDDAPTEADAPAQPEENAETDRNGDAK